MHPKVVFISLAAVVAAASTNNAEAQLMLPGNGEVHLDWGAQMVEDGQLVLARITSPDFGVLPRTATPYVVETLPGKIETFVLMAKHVYEPTLPFNPTFEFSNVLSDNDWGASEIRTGTLLATHPTLDLGVFHLNGSFSSHTEPTVLGQMSSGATATVGGFGQAAFVGGSPWSDHTARAWHMQAVSGGDAHTLLLYFGPTTGLPFRGRALTGSSSGGVYTIAGKLAGIILGGTGGYGDTGYNFVLDFSHPEVASWIHAHTSVPPAVPGDLNGDGVVDVSDLLILLAAWGSCGDPGDCPADLNGDGAVDVSDLLILLANWG